MVDSPRRQGARIDPLSGRPMPICVGIGVGVWLLLSVVPFAGFAGCWLAGYLRRSVPVRDALAGALTGGIGVSLSAALVAVVGPVGVPGLPVDAFSLGRVLATVSGPTPLATYLSVAYVSFLATVGALLGLLGGYYGSGGYGDEETTHQRAIALGRTYRETEHGEPRSDEPEREENPDQVE